MAEEQILLDTGATENFIDQATVNKLRLGTKRLPYSWAVYNIDGTLNCAGTINWACDLLVTQGNKKECVWFFFFFFFLNSKFILHRRCYKSR